MISIEQARRQAPDGDLEAEIVRLVVHGVCHLRGYDHHRHAQRVAMRGEEARLLALIELGAGLIERGDES